MINMNTFRFVKWAMPLITLAAGALFTACHHKDEHPQPAITAINPASGAVGDAVTITGANFSATVSSNAVKFNGTTAVVTAATATSLTTTVPTGATTGKITVTVGDKTATSTSDFTVTAAPSQNPTITDFAPTSGLTGIDVTVQGHNFDATAANNIVKFNGTAATVKSVAGDGTSLVATVPAAATSGKITITAHGNTATSATDFTVIPPAPTITDFTPTAPIGGNVTINGHNFSTTIAGNTVKFFNNITATVISAAADGTSLVATVPAGTTNGKITVTTAGGTVTSANDFAVAPPAINLSASSGAIGKAITITGNFNFDATAANNVVKFNNTQATVTSASTTQLVAEVPYGVAMGAATVSVSVNGGNAVSAPTNFTVVSAWTKKTDFAGGARSSALAFTIGNVGYAGMGIGQGAVHDLYKLDPSANGTWTDAGSTGIDANTIYAFSDFVIGNSAYGIDLNTGNLWEYSSTANTWSNKAVTVPTPSSPGLNVFSINGKGYLLLTTTLYQYDPAANQWTQLTGSFAPPISFGSSNNVIMVIGGKAYISYGGNYYSFDPTTGWVQLQDVPGGINYYSTKFVIGNYGYVRDGSMFWRYNPTNDSWTQLEDVVDTGTFQPTFVLGQKGYVVTGGLDATNPANSKKIPDTWEYDPSK